LLCYCARPPICQERLSLRGDGKICYRIKDTDRLRLMTPVQFLARLSALVPPPRRPLVRFYGVWAPHSRWRSQVVPAPPNQEQQNRPACAERAERPAALPVSRRVQHAAVVLQGVPQQEPPREEMSLPEGIVAPRFSCLSRLDWATLYRRVYDVDPLECPRCGGCLRFAEVIEDVGRARAELRRRNLPDTPPPLARARLPDGTD
jgi:hypothetical protein